MKKSNLHMVYGLLGGLLILGCLSGCGQKSAAPPTGGDAAASSQPAGTGQADQAGGTGRSGQKGAVTLTLGIWDSNQEPFTRELCEAYQRENPEVNIEIQLTPFRQGVGEYWTKLEAGAMGGTAPDVFWCNGLHAQSYMEGGILLDLQDYIEKAGYDLSVFPQAIRDLYTFDGHLYAIPKDFDLNAVWYNKEIFDEAGVSYPERGWTWDDMVDTARKLTDKEKGIYGLAAPLKNQVFYYNTVFAAGGWILSPDRKCTGYDDPKTEEGIQVWLDLIDEGLSPSFADLSDTSEDALFLSGRLAMNWAGSYRTPEYLSSEELKGKIDCVELPSYKGKMANVMHGIGYCVYKQSPHVDEAVSFALWLGGEEAQEIQGKSGVVISARNSAQKYFAESAPEVSLKAYTDQADYAYTYPCCIVSAEIFDTERRYLKQAYSGEKPLPEVCTQLNKETNAILKKADK